MTPLPRPLTRLVNATLPDGSLVDVTIDGETVASVSPASGPEHHSAGSADTTLDLTGHLLLTAPADPHAHLDKALSWEAIRPPMGDLVSAITAWREYARTMTVDDIRGRAREQVLRMLGQGTTAIRTHVDVLLGDEPLRGVAALLAVRDELGGLVDLEIVAMAGPDTPTSDLEAALDLGADLVGGSSHLAQDPGADLARLLAVARARGVGVDVHADESLAGAVTLDALAATVELWHRDGFAPNVSAGHCVRLGTMPADARDDLIAAVKRADIGVIANPITNLYLQGWQHPVSTPRGITAARELLDAGVRFGAGADNVRDPFNPLGRSDALETAMLLVTAGHLTIDEAYVAVSDGARSVMALPAAGVSPGARAELLAVRATSLPDAVANASADRFVIHRGALVAQSAVTRSIADPAPTSSPSDDRKASA